MSTTGLSGRNSRVAAIYLGLAFAVSETYHALSEHHNHPGKRDALISSGVVLCNLYLSSWHITGVGARRSFVER